MNSPLTLADAPYSVPGWLKPGRFEGVAGYVFGFLVLGLAVLVRLLLGFWFTEGTPTYMFFLAPIIVTSVIAGLRPALVIGAASWLVAFYFFIDPAFTLKSGGHDLFIAAIFAAEGTALAYVGGTSRSSLNRLVERDRQLAASETRLRVAQEAARIGTFEWDPISGNAIWSDNAGDILGIDPGTSHRTFEGLLGAVHPDDVAVIREASETLWREGQNKFEYRVLAGDGRVRWIEGNGTALRPPGGPVDCVVAVVMDVTERRRAAERGQFLAEATAELGLSLEYESALANVARFAVPRFADVAAVYLQGHRGAEGRVVAAFHDEAVRPELLASLQEIIASEQKTVIGTMVRSGQPAFIKSMASVHFDTAAVSPAHLELLRELNPSSLICTPLATHGANLGMLIFVDRNGREFDLEDRDVATELGRRAALAIENAQLLEQSFQREAEISRANESLQLIADSSSELSQSLDIGETVRRLAHLVVPRFADVCAISLDENGKLQPVALATATAELEASLHSMSADQAPDDELAKQAAKALESGRPIFLPQIPEQFLQRLGDSPERSAALAAISPGSLILMPMTVRGNTIGIMSFLRTVQSPAFDREDLSLAGQLSRRTALAADNARLYTEARRANDAKDEFLGMMSHELRTPITVIRGGARVLRSRSRHLDDETRESLLDDIERESERLSRMLENLLALARAELDREVILEPVLLQRLLPRLLESQGAGGNREVAFSAEGELPAVAAEPGYIEHIVRNLVGNAIKYSPPDALIEVAVSGCEGGATIRVLDRGFGIDSEEANRIFERFYRSDRTSRLAGGAGLGLAVCKRLVEAMSGEIWAKPREGGGLEVGLRLPAYQEEV